MHSVGFSFLALGTLPRWLPFNTNARMVPAGNVHHRAHLALETLAPETAFGSKIVEVGEAERLRPHADHSCAAPMGERYWIGIRSSHPTDRSTCGRPSWLDHYQAESACCCSACSGCS
jgi:hypothetical protein